MNEWLSSWQTIFKETEKKWALMSQEEQKEQLHYLEETAGTLLDTWTEMDEKINDLREEVGRTDSISFHSKGTWFYELEMFERASLELENEKTNGDKDLLRRLYLGFAFLFSMQVAKAKETFLYLIQVSVHPQIKHFAYMGLGCLQTQEERIQDAIVSFEAAKQLTLTTDVVYNLGVCYFYEEAFHLAEKYFMTYCEEEPEDGEALFFLGCCQWENIKKEDAWASWTTSINLLKSTEALLSLAYVCEWHGYHYLAIHCYKRIQEIHGDTIPTLHGLAWNFALIDDKENALKFFRDVLRLDPGNSDIRQSLQWLGATWPEVHEL
ncbi:tetratricopeptide repeat protein [Halalkalibacter alkalisediminis]|uniref:Tetratricopeptide repeat protein n=1 Tax=Halalkalibacter alkalisediminis TaxID=935616 RepID=A0ABV6NGL8_9BACI|nr:tetratricopeptide repeat protein [Halalkalibacter alkalisediminis]